MTKTIKKSIVNYVLPMAVSAPLAFSLACASDNEHKEVIDRIVDDSYYFIDSELNILRNSDYAFACDGSENKEDIEQMVYDIHQKLYDLNEKGKIVVGECGTNKAGIEALACWNGKKIKIDPDHVPEIDDNPEVFLYAAKVLLHESAHAVCNSSHSQRMDEATGISFTEVTNVAVDEKDPAYELLHQ